MADCNSSENFYGSQDIEVRTDPMGLLPCFFRKIKTRYFIYEKYYLFHERN